MKAKAKKKGADGGSVCVERRRLSDLRPAPYNPRTISEEALDGLEESVSRFGLVQPVIWNRKTGHVVGGHQRLKVLERQGVRETDVVVVSLSEDEEKALNVSLNSSAISGEFTPDVTEFLADLQTRTDPELWSSLRLKDLQEEVERVFADGWDPDWTPDGKEGEITMVGGVKVKCRKEAEDEVRSRIATAIDGMPDVEIV